MPRSNGTGPRSAMSLSLTSFIGTYEKPKVRVIALVLAVLSFGIYAGTIGHGYNMDDVLVTQGHYLTSKGFSAIGQIFTSSYYEDEMGYNYEYRPITHVSFAIEHGLFGVSARVSHLINVLLHAVTVLLVYLVSRMMFPKGNLMFPLLAALLFAVHPMHTEAVASIKNRDELLALLFGLSALYISTRAVITGHLLNWLLVPPLLMLALLSKTSCASFLFLIPICAFLRLDVRNRNGLVALACTILSLFMFFWIREMLFSRAVHLALAISFPFILYIVWSNVSATDFFRVMRVLLPNGWPQDKDLGHSNGGGQMSWSQLTYVGLTGLMAVTSWVFEWHLVVVAVAAVLLFKPYWTGRYDLASPVLLCVLLALLSTRQVVAGTTFLMLLYAMNVSIERVLGRNLFAYGLLFLAFIPEFIAELSALDLDWDVLDFLGFVAYPMPFILTLIYIQTRKSVVVVVWTLVCIVQLVGMELVVGMELDWSIDNESFMLAGSLTFLLHLVKHWPVWMPRPPHVLSILMFLSVATAMIPQSSFLVSFEEVVMNVAIDNSVNNDSDEEVSMSAREDRPLAFLEYPLGIEAPLNERIGTASLVLGHYLVKMFIPWPLAFYYGYDEVPLCDWMHPLAILSLLVHGALLLLVFYFRRSHPILAFGILAYLLSIFLFSNFISPVAGMIGDRLTYVASFGFCVSLGYVLTLVYQRLFTAVAKGMFAVAVGTLMVVWSGMTIARAAKWKDPLTLMRHDVSTVPNSAQAHNILASNLMQASFDPNTEEDLVEMRLEAIHHFRESLRIWPKTMNVWYDLGRAYMIVDDSERALLCFMSAYGLDSTFTYAAWNAAEIAQNLGRDSLAVEYYRHCIRFSPEMEEAYSRLSYIYLIRGEHEKSIAVNRLAIAREPSWRAPYDNMAQVFEAIEMPDSVEAYIRKRNAIGVP